MISGKINLTKRRLYLQICLCQNFLYSTLRNLVDTSENISHSWIFFTWKLLTVSFLSKSSNIVHLEYNYVAFARSDHAIKCIVPQPGGTGSYKIQPLFM